MNYPLPRFWIFGHDLAIYHELYRLLLQNKVGVILPRNKQTVMRAINISESAVELPWRLAGWNVYQECEGLKSDHSILRNVVVQPK
jgi:hypothetical protein